MISYKFSFALALLMCLSISPAPAAEHGSLHLLNNNAAATAGLSGNALVEKACKAQGVKGHEVECTTLLQKGPKANYNELALFTFGDLLGQTDIISGELRAASVEPSRVKGFRTDLRDCMRDYTATESEIKVAIKRLHTPQKNESEPTVLASVYSIINSVNYCEKKLVTTATTNKLSEADVKLSKDVTLRGLFLKAMTLAANEIIGDQR